ncbi:MAG: hypothetical protein ABH851_01345 [Methanobacteriota archaeon]
MPIERSPKPQGDLPKVFEGCSPQLEVALRGVRTRKASKTSYFDLIKPHNHKLIVEMADYSHPEKGGGLSREEFRECMAWNWLANKEMVQKEVTERRLERVRPPAPFKKDDPGSLLLFNEAGTIIHASPPREKGLRDIEYTPMHLRKANPNVPLLSKAKIRSDVYEVGGFDSEIVSSTSGIELLYKSKSESTQPTVDLMKVDDTQVVEPEK